MNWNILNIQQGLKAFGGLQAFGSLFFDFHNEFSYAISCFCPEAGGLIYCMKYGF